MPGLVVLAGLGLGVVFSMPPGPAGAILLNLSLRGARAEALRALGAFLAGELLAMLVALMVVSEGAIVAALPWMRPAAGLFLMAFAISSWRGVGGERGLAGTSPGAVFQITVLNPATWLSAASVLALAPVDPAGGALPKLLFVAAMEVGTVGWYLLVITGAPRVPAAWRHGIERAALLGIGGTGAWFLAAAVRTLVR